MLMLFSLKVTAQKTRSVYFEAGGCGGLGSFNFEKIFKTTGANSFSWRAGLGGSPIDKNNGNVLVFPVLIHFSHGANQLKFEAGIGQGISITTKGNSFARGVMSLGYKYQKKESRLFFRIAYTPLISYLVDFQWQHWAGISVGFHLNDKAN